MEMDHDTVFDYAATEMFDDNTMIDHPNKNVLPLAGSAQDQSSSFVSFSNDQRHMVDLLAVLDKTECPDEAITKIISWAQTAFQQGFQFNPSVYTRRGIFNMVYNAVPDARALLPTGVNVPQSNLPNSPLVEIPFFDFVPQLLSLLNDTAIIREPYKSHNADDHMMSHHVILIVQACTSRTYVDSTLFQEWNFNPNSFYTICPKQVITAVLVTPINETTVAMVEPIQKWKCLFT